MNEMKRLYVAALPTYSKSDYIELEDEESGLSYSAKIFTSHKFPQYLATFIANIGAFALGNAIGWSAPSLPNIEELGDFDNLQANSDMATWIGALTPLGCFFSGFVAGYLIDKIGRKMTMLVMALPFVAGWLIIAFAPNAPCVLVGRFITGFCGGSFTLAVPVYASEIAEDSIRGILSNSMALAVNAGILFTYVVGTLVSWSTSSIINAFLPALFFIGMIFMPETPPYLISKRKLPEAIKSLMWLRGANDYDEVEAEMKSIEANTDSNSKSLTLKDLMSPSVRKPAVICLLLMFFQQFGGINGVIFYSVDIFKDAGTQIDDHVSAIILAVVEVVVVILSTLTVERLGRRILLIVSEVGITISLLALGTYFYIKEKNPEQAAGLGWLPLTSLIVFVLTFNFGMEPVPWTMMGELPPSHAKGLISSLTTAFSWGLAFLITKFFKNLITALTAYGCYWGFSACSFIGLIYCIIFVPETKGKSATEIRQYFEK
ncbi:unnamed protein product [Allacma fusca]|uniref:Major facilitator superfamily (MFS) profile domain-containing protein n=1 Tax=Allacma fusca TaxID=39272 RepID=A0A8J2LP40_9HEXA|nr:unnamed protein product [Allacma fusca]